MAPPRIAAALFFLSALLAASSALLMAPRRHPTRPSLALRVQTDDNESATTTTATAATATPDAAAAPSSDSIDAAALCRLRNLPLTRVKNGRDLSSPPGSPILPNKLYRIGRVGDASPEDIDLLFNELGIKTLVDLRSPTELKDDASLEREEVFGNFTDMVYYERSDEVKELGPEEKRMHKKRKRDKIREMASGVGKNGKDAVFGFVDNFFGPDDDAEINGEDEECNDCIEAEKLLKESSRRKNRKERHFVSIMNELKYVRGTLSKLRKRDIAATLLKSPTALLSKNAREKIKKPFLDEINSGGLPMLNELLLKFGAPGIKHVLDLVSDPNRHPVAFYCTAGKDRTGMIAAIVLSLCGTPDESVIEDYSLSATVYAEMNDHAAMVGALSQRNLDPKTFLGAPPEVMRDTLENIKREYGSVEGYCDWIGFDAGRRERLRYVLTEG